MIRSSLLNERPPGPRRILVVLVVLTVLVVSLPIGAGATAATESTRSQPTGIDSCTTITESGEYRLTQDITNSDETVCIEIRASNVTLDGNGHVVDGRWDVTRFALPETATAATETATADEARTSTTATAGIETETETATATETPVSSTDTVSMGVAVEGNDTAARDAVTVRNLRVSDWTLGVAYGTATDGTISDVTASTNYIGVIAQNAADIEVTGLVATDNLVGVHFSAVENSRITSSVIRNGISAITIHDSDANEITNTTISGPSFLGVGLIDSNAHRLANSSITGVRGTVSLGPMNSTAIGIDNSSEFSVEDTVTANNENWTFISENGSADTVVENLTVDELSVSFTGADIGLDTTRADPLGRSTGDVTGLQVVKTSETSEISIEVNWTLERSNATAARPEGYRTESTRSPFDRWELFVALPPLR